MRRFFTLLFLLTIFVVINQKTFAQAAPIFSENFESSWTTPNTLGTTGWTSNPASPEDQVWHREDYTTGWTFPGNGGYTPAGANATSHSARFHTYGAANGTTGEMTSPVLDFSCYAGQNILMSIYYRNASGSDNVRVEMSSNGGGSWLGLTLSGTNTGWTASLINFGNTFGTNNVLIRLRGTSDFGLSDMGIDEINVYAGFFSATAGNYTWTVPAGITSLNVAAFGGGGGGGSSNNGTASGGSGGGGAAYANGNHTVVPSTLLHYRVGAGGIGGPGNSTTQPTNGLPTWLNATGANAQPATNVIGTLADFGRAGANNSTATPTNRGTAAASMGNIATANGNNGTGGTNNGGGSGGNSATGAAGNINWQGAGGAGVNSGVSNPGVVPGGGGGGSDDVASRAGGAGAAGFIVVTYSFPKLSSPTITTNPICSGNSITVSGTSSEPNGTTITLYGNGLPLGTTTVTGGNWTMTGLNIAGGVVLTAKASSTACNYSNPSAAVVVTYSLTSIATNPAPNNNSIDVCYAGGAAFTNLLWDVVPGASQYDVYFGIGAVPGAITATVATNTWLITPALVANTTYFWKVVPKNICGLTTGTAQIWTFTTVAAPCLNYCIPTHTTGVVANTISLVEFVGTQNDVTNNSGTGFTGAYQDFTTLPHAVQEQGEAVNINVFSGTASTYWKAWVDWNRDGTFQDPAEMVYTSGVTQFTFSTTLGFQIPLGQAPGSYRIRIRTQDYNGCTFGGACGNNTLTPCTNMQDGQAEDYLFEVIARCNARITNYISDTVCSNNPVTLTLGAEGTAQTTGFSWYANQTGGSPLASTVASGAPPAASWTTPSINTTTTYWVTATGTNTALQACESYTRVPVVAFKPTLATINFVGGNPVYWCSGGTSINVTGSSGTIENKLIDVDFENGTLGEFTVQNIGTLQDPVNQPWAVKTSIFVPGMTAVWKPAVSSGFGANKFAFAIADIFNSGTYHTFLTSAAHNTTGYTNLRLDFRMYFDHYLADGQAGILDTVTVQASNNNGTSWNTLQSFIGDQGKASNFADFTYNLAASYNNQANVRVRFVFGANWTNGVAIDSVRLSGTTSASSNYVWTPVNGNSGGNLYLPPYPPGTAYAGQNVSNIVVAPTPAQLSAGDPLDFEAALTLGNGCVAKDTISVIIDNNIWLGYTADWNSNTNWCGGIPIFGSKVFVPTTPIGGNMPIIYSPTTGTATSVTIDNGASLTINNGAALQLRRDLDTYVGGTFTNNGTLEMMGDNVFTQNLPGPGTISPMNNLTIDYTGSLSVILNAPITITGRLKPKQGTFYLGEDSITLKSTATSTAYVDTVKSTAGITYGTAGRFVVERYIKYYKNWNMLASPTAEAQTIRQSWQENGVNNAGYGTIITGPAPLGTGLDAVSPLPSMKWYNPNIDTFKAVNNTTLTNTDSLVNRNTGYFLFVRGDRSVGVGGAGNNTTLRSRGKLYIGSTGGTALPPPNVSFNGLTTGEFVSIANPFASVIDPTITTATNLKSAYTVWDPSNWGNFGAGAYITFTQSAGWIGTPTPSGGSPYPSGVYKSIQSGQAYLMEVNTGGGNVSVGFEENDKNNSTINTVTRLTEMPPGLVMMSTMLHNSAGLVADGNRVSFNEMYSNSLGNEDATKLMNSGENFGILQQGKKLIIDGRKPVADADTIFYAMSGLRIQNYMLSFEPVNLVAPGLTAELIDQFLGTRTAISLTDSSFYNFSATNDPASRAINRFYLVFKAPAAPVPVKFVSITASRNTDRSIKVNWAVVNEINISHYEIERSENGINFTGIINAAVANNNNYSRNDLSPLVFDNYYRIKAVGINGDITYSPIVKVAPENILAAITVVPNPVKGKQMQLRFTGVREGKYNLVLQSEAGQRIYREAINIGSNYEVKNIRLKKAVAAGAYFIKLQNSDKETIAVEKLFIE